MGLRKLLCILSLILTMLPVTSVYAEGTDSISASKFQYKSQYWCERSVLFQF